MSQIRIQQPSPRFEHPFRCYFHQLVDDLNEWQRFAVMLQTKVDPKTGIKTELESIFPIVNDLLQDAHDYRTDLLKHPTIVFGCHQDPKSGEQEPMAGLSRPRLTPG